MKILLFTLILTHYLFIIIELGLIAWRNLS